MSIQRSFTCDIKGCSHVQIEVVHGQGPRDFGQFVGITLNGINDPMLCPAHRAAVANFVDKLEGYPEVVDISGGVGS